jgi:hypothetical protein
VDVSAHLFRTTAATTAALYGPDVPHLASAVLGHCDPRVTEEHYIRATTVNAAKEYAAILRRRRHPDSTQPRSDDREIVVEGIACFELFAVKQQRVRTRQRIAGPLGGGIGRVFKFGGQAFNAQVEAFYNVLRAGPGSISTPGDWQFRFARACAPSASFAISCSATCRARPRSTPRET